MKPAELALLVEALRPAIQTFIRESRSRIALLINGAGQVLAQHGFTRSYEVMNVASLAAAAHASSHALAQLTGAQRWLHLYHAGRERQLFLAPISTPAQELILVVIFDADSSLGIVRLFFDELQQQVARLPELRGARQGSTQASFERDLAAGLEIVASPPASED